MAKEIGKKALTVKKARRAQKEMLAYMQEHDLDPNKDWTTHKKHGKKIQDWADIINLGNKKAKEINDDKADKDSKARVEKKLKKLKKPDVNPKVKVVESTPNSYDYPTIDGKPMPTELKKKYRQKMRILLKTKSKEVAEKEAKVYTEGLIEENFPIKATKKVEEDKEVKSEKKSKKVKSGADEKVGKKDKKLKKKKKAAVEED